MSPVAELLFQQVSELPEEERAEIAHRLAEPDEDDPEYKEWRAEIDRRLQAVEDGTDRTVDAKEYIESLRQKSLVASSS